MDLPSGDHWMELTAPCRLLTCFTAFPARVQTKTLFCEVAWNLPPVSEQSDRNARCLPSGDQVGCEALQAPGALLAASAIVSGEITLSARVPCTGLATTGVK